jgi:hypothetical protein
VHQEPSNVKHHQEQLSISELEATRLRSCWDIIAEPQLNWGSLVPGARCPGSLTKALVRGKLFSVLVKCE